MPISWRRLLIGNPLPTERAAHERLGKFLALPIFASDAVSSVAYATGEIMAALILAGPAALKLTFYVALAIVGLLFIVATSYRQTIMAYPGGGGAYIVARDNLNATWAQVAGAALLVDYILTVAVSVSSGVQAVDSLWFNFTHNTQHINILFVAVIIVVLMTLVNLRGVRESGVFFAIPSYSFISIVYILVLTGLYQLSTGHLGLAWPQAEFLAARSRDMAPSQPFESISLFLILHAFASGCTALTGVEAISNGVTAFKPPAAKNARDTMVWMAVILALAFSGLAFLAVHANVLPEIAALGRETTISQLGRTIFGVHPAFGWLPLYWWLQLATALILVVAANTSFAGFPRLCALQAKDGFLPKQLANMGDRLVFDRGIITLAVFALALLIGFKADVHKLIPLYAIGVFLSFTLSQVGMVKRWFRLKSPRWQVAAIVNGTGAVVTAIVAMVFAIVKFRDGAYIVVFLIPLLVFIFFRIHAHYVAVRDELDVGAEECFDRKPAKHAVLVLVPGVTRGSLKAIDYARSLTGDCRAIHLEVNPEQTPALRDAWTRHCDTVPLVILASPYRTVIDPLMEYLDEVQKETPNTQITVVVPEFVPPRWWQGLLHGHTGLMLKLALLGRENVVVTNVRYRLKDEQLNLRAMFDVEDYKEHM